MEGGGATATAALSGSVLKRHPGLLGAPQRPGLQALPRLITDAEDAIQAGNLELAGACLDTFFAETNRAHASKAAALDQFVCRAHFAAGQLVSKLSSSCKGQQLVDAVLEAVGHIMRGVELAAANPRYSHLIYNGSVHYHHAVRPLQCDKLRHHLLPSQEKLCQALEKVEGQPAWRVRQLLSLALCQSSEDCKPDELNKTLAKALELATTANLPSLRAEVLALQTHHQTLQATKAAASKPGASAGTAAKGAAATASGPPPPAAAAAPKQAAPGGKRKPGELQPAPAGKADVDGALAALQWVLTAKPEPAVAEQKLQAALKLVDVRPDKGALDVNAQVVGRIAWAAAVCGVPQLAEASARKAASSQDLGPRVWADLTRLLLSLQAAPAAVLGPSSDSSGSGAALDPAALKARREVLEGVDEVVSAFLKLGDVQGIHNCAVLAWNAGLPLLQPRHRSVVRPTFMAVAKALESVGSPWGKLRAALHLEVAKAEADADSFIKAAKEVSQALSLNYPSDQDVAAVCGYERPLDRFLEPLAHAAQLRGVAPMQHTKSSSRGSCSQPNDEEAAAADDDVVLLLERTRDSKSGPLRSEYLQKAINKLVLLPEVPPPASPASTEALQQQLRAARARTQLWASIVELAWRPCELHTLVRAAVPYVLGTDWQPIGDSEMLILQARVALVGADAAKAALAEQDAELVLPEGYAPSSSSSKPHADGQAAAEAARAGGAGAADSRAGSASAAGKKAAKAQATGSIVKDLQKQVADYMLQALQLAVAAGNSAWLVMNAAMAVWNSYLPLMQRDRYAELTGLLLPVLQHLLQEPAGLEPNRLVMLAEAAAKAAEHTALLTALQQQQQRQQGADTALPHAASSPAVPCKPLGEVRSMTAGVDLGVALAASADVLQLVADTAAGCQAALTRAAAAAEPQGLIQAYARLQQLQGKPVTVPPGAPAAMAATSKVLALLEGLTATAPCTGSSSSPAQQAAEAVPARAATGAARGPSATAAAAASAGKVSAAAGKGAAPAAAVNKAEQDIRAAMSLLSAMPSVNLQMWSQLSRAAGWHGCWLLSQECASAALTALPEDKRDLAAVAAASDIPQVGPQGWYWLAVAEMQQGQAVLSLLPKEAGPEAVAASLSLRHTALQHFATAARLASFIRSADLAESAARLAFNVTVQPGGLMECCLASAGAIAPLLKAAAALNSTRPADIGFQVKLNALLLECLAAAGRWQEARSHVEALHRSLPASKQKGPVGAAAVDTLAGWRAVCLVKAPSGRPQEDMTRLLSDLSTPQAKAGACLAYAQASTNPGDQLAARQSALAALEGLPADAKVEYQLEFAQWLAASRPAAAAANTTTGLTAEHLLLDAAAALTAEGVGSRPDQLSQLLRVELLLSQVAAQNDARMEHLLQAQLCGQQLLTSSLLAAGATPAPISITTSAGAESPSSMDSNTTGAATAEAAAAAATVSAEGSSVQEAAAAVPSLPIASLGGAAANASPRPADPAASGLVKSPQLPSSLLEWATWLPNDELLQSLHSSKQHLSQACLPTPELLLANLQVLSQQLAAAGCHAASLPVLQLARLVAEVVLQSQVAASAVALQLSELCEQLCCTAAAADWLALAAPDSWPSQDQLQAAEQSKAVQQLAADILEAHATVSQSSRGSRPASAQVCAEGKPAAAAGGVAGPAVFMADALAAVEPAVLQALLLESASAAIDTTNSSDSSCGQGSLPGIPKAQGTGAAGVGRNTGSQLGSRIGLLQVLPLKPLSSCVSIARYFVDHAQYTAGRRLCGYALELARSCGDRHHQAEVLMLQARLSLLASQHDEAIKLAQAAQALGGSVELWRDSVLCYAAARRDMPGRGPADALEALEGGVDLLVTALREHSGAFKPTVLAACARLKLELSQELFLRAGQQLQEAQEDPGCGTTALQLHHSSVSLSKAAAGDAHQAGAALLEAQALQMAAGLLTEQHQYSTVAARVQHNNNGSMWQQEPPPRAMPPSDGQVSVLEAVEHLQAAQQVLHSALAAEDNCLVQHGSANRQQQQQQEGSDGCDSTRPSGTASPRRHTTALTAPSTPARRALASVLVQLSQVELTLAQQQLRQGGSSSAAAELEFPRVEGRDARAVIAYLSASTSSGTDQPTSWIDKALQHAYEAVEAALTPAAHAAALLAVGRAHMLQAHAAVQHHAASTAAGDAAPEVNRQGGDGAWYPPGWQPMYPSRGVQGMQHNTSSSALAAEPAPVTQAAPAAPEAGSADVAAGAAGADAAEGAQTAACSSPNLQVPVASAEEPFRLAVQHLQQALYEALQEQEQQIAGAAACSLMYCYGQLQPERAAVYGAVAQSCSAATWMRELFEQAASQQHTELLLWRQLQQLEPLDSRKGVHSQQVAQLLSLLGLTSKRLQVPQPEALMPLLAQATCQQRLLLLHHDASTQQLVLAAWGAPACKQTPQQPDPSPAEAASAATAAPTAAAAPAPTQKDAGGASQTVSSSGGTQSARNRRSTAKDAALAAAATDSTAATDAAAAALPPAAILCSMPCSEQQLQDLAAAFAAYAKQLHKAVVVAVAQSVPVPASSDVGNAAAAAAVAAAPKKPPASAAGKGSKEKATGKEVAAEVPAWVPSRPVFPQQLNQQWRELMQQFEELLQPAAAFLQDALQPYTPTAEPTAPSSIKQGARGTSGSGSKAAAAAAAATQQPLPTSLQLLLDPQLCDLPWEALPVFKRSCSSVARCVSLAQLQLLLQPPQLPGMPPAGPSSVGSGGGGPSPAAAAAAANSTSLSAAVPLELSKLGYLVDPMHHMSSAAGERHGCYAVPLLPGFRQQLLEPWGQAWQGFAGTESQVPSDDQMLRPLAGCKGLLFLGPGRLLGHLGVQAVAGMDLTSCNAAVLLDRLDNAAAAAHQTRLDNRKTAPQRALEGPCHTAVLLMLRGVRAAAVAALPGTPHTHLGLAANILRALSGAAVQPVQAPTSNGSGGSDSSAADTSSSSGSGGSAAAPADACLIAAAAASGPLNLGQALLLAQRQGLAGFELEALRDAGLVLYGLPGVVAGEGVGAAGKAKSAKKG